MTGRHVGPDRVAEVTEWIAEKLPQAVGKVGDGLAVLAGGANKVAEGLSTLARKIREIR